MKKSLLLIPLSTLALLALVGCTSTKSEPFDLDPSGEVNGGTTHTDVVIDDTGDELTTAQHVAVLSDQYRIRDQCQCSGKDLILCHERGADHVDKGEHHNYGACQKQYKYYDVKDPIS